MNSKPNVKWAKNYDGSVLMKMETMFDPRIRASKVDTPLWYKIRSKRSPYRLGKMEFEEFSTGKEHIEEEPKWTVDCGGDEINFRSNRWLPCLLFRNLALHPFQK